MEVIKHTNGHYVRFNKGRPELVKELSSATKFNNGKGSVMITSQIGKKTRNEYSVEVINAEEKVETHKEQGEMHKTNVIKICDNLIRDISEQLKPEKEALEKELRHYDESISDILHILGDENTKLNACEGYKVTRKIQSLERRHTAVKKELNRINQVIQQGKILSATAKNFNYVPYKPRVIGSLAEVIR